MDADDFTRSYDRLQTYDHNILGTLWTPLPLLALDGVEFRPCSCHAGAFHCLFFLCSFRRIEPNAFFSLMTIIFFSFFFSTCKLAILISLFYAYMHFHISNAWLRPHSHHYSS